MTRLGGWATPGVGALDITTEKQLTWGYGSVNNLVLLKNALILGGTVDSTNTPTNVLRPGLVLGLQSATGKYTNYSSNATDGSQIASTILFVEVISQDFTGTNSDRSAPVMVGGPVKANQLIGLDALARAQLSKQFLFDDDLGGNRQAPALMVTKTASYSVLAADRGTTFIANGSGAITFTLPAIADGLWFKFINLAGQNMVITSNEGTNIVTYNNAAASSLTFSTSGQLIGAAVAVYSNPGATLWYSELLSKNAVTVS